MNPKVKIAVVAVIVIGVIAGVGYWYWQKPKKAPSATEALEEVESAAPKIGVPASPVEGKIPALNPVEQANPFKYNNPFR